MGARAARGGDRADVAPQTGAVSPGVYLALEPPVVTAPAPARTFETIAQSVERIGVCSRTIRRAISDGRLTGYRLNSGRLIRLIPAEVDAALFRPIPTGR